MNAATAAATTTDSAPLPTPRRRRAWPLVVGAVLALALLALVVLLAVVAHADLPNVSVTVDGVRHGAHLDLASMPPAHKVMLTLGVVFAVVLALLVVPVVLLIVVTVLLITMLAGIGLPVLAVLAIGMAMCSPLILLGLAIYWWLRRPGRIPA